VPGGIQQKETPMAAPFIFIGTHRLKEGKLQDLRHYEQELVALVEAKEPRLIAFHVFVNEDGTQATTIQVHPDAASMEFHMQVLGQKISQAYAFLERTERIEVYGTPSDQVLEMMRQLAGSGVPLSVKADHLGGFTRVITGRPPAPGQDA
jgi:quinol monooxygenase YgiN